MLNTPTHLSHFHPKFLSLDETLACYRSISITILLFSEKHHLDIYNIYNHRSDSNHVPKANFVRFHILYRPPTQFVYKTGGEAGRDMMYTVYNNNIIL